MPNLIHSLNCLEKKLKRGLPTLEEYKENLKDYGSTNYFFTYGDGTGVTVLVGSIFEDELVWFRNQSPTTQLSRAEVSCKSEWGYTWPIDKFGNKI